MFKKKMFFVMALILGVMLAFTLIGCGGGDSGGGGSDDGYPSDEDYKQAAYADYADDPADFAEGINALNQLKGWNLSTNPHNWSSADWRKFIDFAKEMGGSGGNGGDDGSGDDGSGGSDSSGLSAAEQSVWDGIKMAYNANPETIQQSIQDINSAYNLNLPTNPNTWTTAQAKAYYAAATGGGGSGDDGSGGSGDDNSGGSLTAAEQQAWNNLKMAYGITPTDIEDLIRSFNEEQGQNLPLNPNDWSAAQAKIFFTVVENGPGD